MARQGSHRRLMTRNKTRPLLDWMMDLEHPCIKDRARKNRKRSRNAASTSLCISLAVYWLHV